MDLKHKFEKNEESTEVESAAGSDSDAYGEDSSVEGTEIKVELYSEQEEANVSEK
jgi:hypothetical protein